MIKGPKCDPKSDSDINFLHRTCGPKSTDYFLFHSTGLLESAVVLHSCIVLIMNSLHHMFHAALLT